MKTLAFTAVTMLTFAALPAVAFAQEVDEDAEAEAISEVVDDVVAPDLPPPVVDGDLPVTLPDPAAVPPAGAPGRLDTPDAVFIADALRDGEMEVASAALARDRGSSPGIRTLAERLENDHEALNDRLRALAAAGAATEPRGRPAHREMDALQALDDEAFDAAWLAVEEKHHRMTIEKFERAAASPALDVPVRSLADEALTTLRAHADAVRDLRDALGFD